MKKILLVILLIFANTILAQDIQMDSLTKTKKFSFGVKVGAPNILSVNGEFVLPILNNHFAPYIDYGSFNLDIDNTEANMKYIEYGLNFYINKKGKGLYIGAGSGKLTNEFTFKDLEFEENGVSLKGNATTNLDINSFNFKLGFKTGGLIYVRLEVGYGIGTIPDSLNFTATSGGITETFSEDLPSIPGISSNGLIIGNIGLGLSF
ncbi:MAG: Uncharacterised protein [Cryomorphaceae bacterium]|nr:MAG: Uncharacterised protein [Cryomorphaceae bacterium]